MTMFNVLRDYLDATERFLVTEADAWHTAQTEYLLQRGYTMSEIEAKSLEVGLTLAAEEFLLPGGYPGYTYNIESEFPNILRKSVFITAYSVFEDILYRRCRYIQGEHEFGLSVTDLKGIGIQRSRDYLAKVVGFDFSSLSEWPEVVAYNKLRNCIVHNTGRLEGSRDSRFLRVYITNHRYLDLRYNEVVLLRGFCEEAIGKFEALDKYLGECYGDWLRHK